MEDDLIKKLTNFQLNASVNDVNELSKIIDKYLVPQELERKRNAEISTPYHLRQDMINIISTSFWKKGRLIFEPCCGKGGFLLDIVHKMMNGLVELVPDPTIRYKFIVEYCLYFSDINPMNIFICKLLLDPHGQYKLNYFTGDTLTLDVFSMWKPVHEHGGFDLIIGNPPYNKPNSVGTGNSMWSKFIIYSLKILKESGKLIFVNPPGWRKPVNEKSKYTGLFKLMTSENQMLYLEIHDVKDGIKTFRCGTRYDWYVIQKKKNIGNITIIRDENRKITKINLLNWEWIPNYNFDLVEKILHKNIYKKCEVIYSRTSYGADKKWVVNEQTDEYKYTLIDAINKNKVRYKYTNINNKGQFGIKKIIIGSSGLNSPIIDMSGKYGMTQHSFGIKINSINEGENIKKTILSNKFKDLIKSCSWSNFLIDWILFTFFKHNFWKEFI